MREIKFRAWDKKLEKMCFTNIGYEDFSYHIAWFPSQKTNYPALYRNSCLVETGYEIMQYTGLKDKNKVEIYGRDIVHAGAWGTAGYYDDDDYIVDFDKGAFRGFRSEYYKNKKMRWPMSLPLYKLENLEVIGNIYENPELLK